MASDVKTLEVKYSFLAELSDPQTTKDARKYHVYFYSPGQAIELYDLKSKRLIFHKSPIPNIRAADVFVGAQLTIYCRVFTIVDYGDDDTRLTFANRSARSLYVLKPSAFRQLGKIIELLHHNCCALGRVKAVKLEDTEAAALFEVRSAHLFGQAHPCVVLEVFGAHNRLSFLPLEHGYLYTDDTVYVASKLVFKPSTKHDQSKGGRGVVIVKPHALLRSGNIIDALLQKFDLIAIQSFCLGRTDAEDFFGIYKDDADFQGTIEQMISGMCFAIEVKGEQVVSKLREFCGPPDPEIAKKLFPQSLRAKYGQDKIKNAVHCSELEQDGELESKFFFSILNQPS